MSPEYGSFYRYRSFPDENASGEHRDEAESRIRAMFEDRTFWFAAPSSLNDPFDCRPVLLWSDDEAENRFHIDQAWREGFERDHGVAPPSDMDREIDAHVTNILAELSTQASRNAVFWRAVDERTAVLCLSRRWDIIQQWTYYAREHTGFCIEFAIDEQSELAAFAIDYVQERPAVEVASLYGPNASTENLIGSSVLKKAETWQHEAEVRVLQHQSGNVRIPQGVLKSVTFGINSPQDRIAWLQTICEDAQLKLDFYRCVMDDWRFALQREPLQNQMCPWLT
ncbi:MAG: DUF2971 domain-containing protein [Pseudomonadota bacterium]